MSFQQTFQKPISTTNTTKPSNPDITINNPLDKKGVFVNLIEIVPDAEFTAKGKIIILVNEIPIFDNSDDSNAFVGIARKVIPLENSELNRGSFGKIKIFAWNGTDSNTICLVIAVKISESTQTRSYSIIPLTKDFFNIIVSENETIIAFATYFNQKITKLIDMKGYKKFIV